VELIPVAGRSPASAGRRAAGGGKRRAARLAAVQALYQLELGGGEVGAVIGEFEAHRLGQVVDELDAGPADVAWFGELVRGVTANRAELDNLVAAVLTEDWSVDRLDNILRSILRAGVYELSAHEEVPARAAVSEYVELADAFFSGKEIGLVNGVLDQLARLLRPGEMGVTGEGRTIPVG
jgi:transcription antitermination protein NusB